MKSGFATSIIYIVLKQLTHLLEFGHGFATSIIYIVLKLIYNSLFKLLGFATSIIYIVLKLSPHVKGKPPVLLPA